MSTAPAYSVNQSMLDLLGDLWLQGTKHLLATLGRHQVDLQKDGHDLAGLLVAAQDRCRHVGAQLSRDAHQVGQVGQAVFFCLDEADLQSAMHALLDLADWCAAKESRSVGMGFSGGVWREAKQSADLLGGLCYGALQVRSDPLGTPLSESLCCQWLIDGLLAMSRLHRLQHGLQQA